METTPALLAYRLGEDDPRRCTALVLRRHGLLRVFSRPSEIPDRAVVLNPEADAVLAASDRGAALAHGLVVIDSSWKAGESIFHSVRRGLHRRLPPLLAANPINYGRWEKLSSAEALAAALWITGFEELSRAVLSKFKWGDAFWTLNAELLPGYPGESTSSEGSG